METDEILVDETDNSYPTYLTSNHPFLMGNILSRGYFNWFQVHILYELSHGRKCESMCYVNHKQ